MIKWFKTLWRIVKTFDAQRQTTMRLMKQIAELESLIRDRTTVGVDVGFKTAHHVIMMGKYNGVDYVESYGLRTEDFAQVVDHLRNLKKLGTVDRFDAPPQFRAVMKRDMTW